MVRASIHVHGARVEAGERDGTIWLDIMERDDSLAIARFTVFVDYANVSALLRQIDRIAMRLAPLHASDDATVAGVAEVAIPR